MAEQQDMTYEPGQEPETMMVYIDPQALHSLEQAAKNKEQQVQELLDAAEDGDLEAQLRLAQRYQRGSGTAVDLEKAFYWFSQAAEGGHIAAQHELGRCYGGGFGTDPDHDKAAELFAVAAEQGFAPSICELGLCYEIGQGVPMDKSAP